MIELTSASAPNAAKLGLGHKALLADNAVLATPRAYGASLGAQGADFEELRGVRFRCKTQPPSTFRPRP